MSLKEMEDEMWDLNIKVLKYPGLLVIISGIIVILGVVFEIIFLMALGLVIMFLALAFLVYYSYKGMKLSFKIRNERKNN